MPLPGLVAAGIAVGSQLLAQKSASNQVNKTHEANRRAAAQEFQNNLSMWHMQNRYNDPSMQMQRLKAAGLNPNLVYGTGAVGNNAAPPPKYNAPQYDFRSIPAPVNGGEAISSYQNAQLQQAQIDLINSQAHNVRARTLTETQQLFLNDLKKRMGEQSMAFKVADNEIQKQRLNQMRALAPYQQTIVQNQAAQSENKVLMQFQQLKNMKKDEVIKGLEIQAREKGLTSIDLANEKKRAEIIFQQYENEWRKEGITSSDNYLMRALARSFDFKDLQTWRNQTDKNDQVWQKYSTPYEPPVKLPHYNKDNYPRKPK